VDHARVTIDDLLVTDFQRLVRDQLKGGAVDWEVIRESRWENQTTAFNNILDQPFDQHLLLSRALDTRTLFGLRAKRGRWHLKIKAIGLTRDNEVAKVGRSSAGGFPGASGIQVMAEPLDPGLAKHAEGDEDV
jgi:hypothetical protein